MKTWQKILYFVSLGVGAIGTLGIVAFTITSHQSLENAMVISGEIERSNWQPADDGAMVSTVTAVEDSQIQIGKSTLFLPSATELQQYLTAERYTKISANQAIYLQTESLLLLAFGAQYLPVENVSGVYNPTTNEFHILAGEITLNDTTLISGDTIYQTAGIFSSHQWDRSKISNSQVWARVINMLKEFNALPEALSDLTPPDIRLTQPDFAETVEDQVAIAGYSETGVTINISDEKTQTDNEGFFKLSQDLSLGVNDFLLEATDKWGNIATTSVTISRVDTTISAPIVDLESRDCSNGSIEQQLLCQLNQARSDQDLPNLDYVVELGEIAETIARNHSVDENYSIAQGLEVLTSHEYDSDSAEIVIYDFDELLHNGIYVFNAWSDHTSSKQVLESSLTDWGLGIYGKTIVFCSAQPNLVPAQD